MALLAVALTPVLMAASAFTVITHPPSEPIESPVTDMALLADDRLLVLGAERVLLYRLRGAKVVLESSLPLPGPFRRVRAPAGTILAEEDAAWVLTNGARRALLVGIESGNLTWRTDADALPGGLHYRPGTNWIESAATDPGPGPFLLRRNLGVPLAVTTDARLLLSGSLPDPDLRVGPSAATLWPGVLALSSAVPPGERDQVLLLEHEPGQVRLVQTLEVSGAVRALTGRVSGNLARLVIATEEVQSQVTRLVLLDLERRSQ